MIGTNFGIFRPSQSSGQQSFSQGSNGNAAGVGSTDARVQGLSDFIQQLEDYVPTVPDAVTAHYLNSAGFESGDPRIVRLISVATQKFISDVANDALQHCRIRTNSQANSGLSSAGTGAANNIKGQKPAKDRKYTLTVDDLTPALADYGITVRKAQYFV